MEGIWQQADAAIIGFFNAAAQDPAGRAPVRNNWPVHRLDHAVYLSAAYVAFVVGCKLTLDKGVRKSETGGKKPKASVADKIKQDGLLVFASMALYNATQVALCGWMVYASLAEHRRRGMSLVCNDHKLEEDGMAFVLHIFYLSKILDFADTVFMIVKNNWHQVSFLHVYHHSSIFLIYWLNANAFYDADIYFTIVLNGAIHFIMYGYYFATAFNVQVPIFIKKSITNSQLMQFCCMEAQGLYLLCFGCNSPNRITVLYMVYISTMLALFMDFKRRAYSNAKKAAKAVPAAKEKTEKSDDEKSEGVSTAASDSEVKTCCGWEVGTVKKAGKVAKSKEVPAASQKATAVVEAAAEAVAKKDAMPSQGKTEMYIDGRLYDIADFKHPGGSVINFYKGTGDATATFKQFHIRSKKAQKMVAALPNRPCPADADGKVQHDKKRSLDEDFKKLTEELEADGFFKPHYGEIVYRFSEIIVMFAIGVYIFRAYESASMRILGLLVTGLASGRCGWLMHEGGHGSLTGDMKTDRNLQVITYGFGCGMSGGWWRSNHNRHHATPQKLKHDADLDTLPLVAFNEAVVKRVPAVVRTWLKAQGYLFMPLTCFLVVLGWQLFLHPRYILRTSKWNELATLVARYIAIFKFMLSGYSWGGAIACYCFVQQIAGCYIFTNFALSHTHLDVVQDDEHKHWVEYGAEHTTNLSNHWFVNWWMAYLNFQIEHHLFPTMPQFRHPEVSKRVKILFAKHGLHYDVRGYFSCLGDTLKNLHDVGQAAQKKTK
eukprot:TRINITY_DN208_c0_g3_i1.p1 TRINITY_DN208_c0_g3~~TRINITY_DN208_c0_g3_i1.p1  ORF type:complete len:772 (-),score=198.11 TRINITY_DN208_c0_g3_i1:118-2433(-)